MSRKSVNEEPEYQGRDDKSPVIQFDNSSDLRQTSWKLRSFPIRKIPQQRHLDLTIEDLRGFSPEVANSL